MKGPLFYAKILLFGEYGIIKDSKGLSIPYNFYNGALKIDEIPDASTHKSNQSLKRFSVFCFFCFKTGKKSSGIISTHCGITGLCRLDRGY